MRRRAARLFDETTGDETTRPSPRPRAASARRSASSWEGVDAWRALPLDGRRAWRDADAVDDPRASSSSSSSSSSSLGRRVPGDSGEGGARRGVPASKRRTLRRRVADIARARSRCAVRSTSTPCERFESTGASGRNRDWCRRRCRRRKIHRWDRRRPSCGPRACRN